MKYMKTPAKIDFDDDLINILIIIIKTLKYLPNLAINLLPDIGQVLRKNKGMTKNLFTLINLYIIYSNGEIEKEDNSKYLFKLYKKCFSKENFHKESPYLCTIIIEIWLIICSIIPQKTVTNIITFAFERLQDVYFGVKQSYSDMGKTGFDIQILGLGLTNLILSSFVHYSNYVSDIFNLKDIIQYASYITMNKLNYSLYENKIFVLSLCSILRNKNLITKITDEAPKIISFCYNILKRIAKKELKINNNINEINFMMNKNNKDEKEKIEEDEDNVELDQDQKKNDKIKRI